MRIFSNPKEAYDEVGRDLWEMGIRVHTQTMQDKNIANDKDYETVELRAYCYQISPGYEMNHVEKMVKETTGQVNYCLAEFTDRVDPNFVNPGKSWKVKDIYGNSMEEVWKEFIHDGKFAYTYSERYKPQLNKLIEELRKNPESRQCILTMYDYHLDQNNWGGGNRIPCSLIYQFMIREKALDCIYIMRSCDYLTHFPHDMYLTIRLMFYIADAVDVDYGYFTHFMGSLHAYEKDIKKLKIF